MNELLAQFVAEARDLLQEAGHDLLALEQAPADEPAINRLFRSVHTLKGSSGLFDAAPLTQVLHAAEDIFQAVREHGLALTPDMVDLTLQALDQVGRWIEHLDGHDALPDDAASQARVLVTELRRTFGRRTGKPLAAPVMEAAGDATVAPPDVLRWFSRQGLLAASECAARSGRIHLVSFAPPEDCFFRGEDPLHLALQIPHLLAFAIEARASWPSLGSLDPFCCTAAFHAFSSAERIELEALFRYVPDQVSILGLTAAALAGPASAPAGRSHELTTVARALLEEQLALLHEAGPREETAGRIEASARVAANALHCAGAAEAAACIERAGAQSVATLTVQPLAEAIAALLRDADDKPAAAANPATPRPTAEAGERPAPRSLRVDQEKVDMLMNLVGELVVAKNSLPFLARRAEDQYGVRDLALEIRDQYGIVDRIAQELQGAVMAIRMMPVGHVFQRLPRLVRDLSRKLGKQVDLVIEGEATEADKNVIESLFDPLLHMVRNSLDHGIETPAERLACGKPGCARVSLAARQEGDQVVIEVTDDGRGIDSDIIKRRAFERGLIDAARLSTISDDEATMLVFEAGFSTAKTVSDVSGRGVGMDVVRNAVHKAGGRIAMTSRKGVGTTVRLDLPLSMAVSRVMTVALDDRLFGIPMDLIQGTLKIQRSSVVRVGTGEAFILRDRVVPLLRLSRLLDLCPAIAGDEIAVLVVRIDGQTVGLEVAAFGDGMEVILKPLAGMLARVAGYSGTALLGDGRVLLVLDLRELIR
nr:chemotaxis protein CheA [uncultured Lichenicoccus sp.]